MYAPGGSAMASKSSAGDAQSTAAPILTYMDLDQALLEPGADIPTEALATALLARIGPLSSCGEADPSPSTQAKSKLDSSATLQDDAGNTVKASSELKKLASNFSEKLGVDQTHTAVLLHTYTHRHGINAAELDSLSDSQQDELYDRLTEFHFEERLAKIRCVQHLLFVAESNHHPFQQDALQILAKVLNDGFGARCLRSFITCTKRAVPPHMREVTAYASFWATQMLKEQLALLELAFHFFRNRPASPENVHAVINACVETDIGKQQASQGFFPAQADRLQQSVRDTLVLLMVLTLDLDAYSGELELSPSSSSQRPATPSSSTAPTHTRTLADDPATVRKAIDFLDFDEADPLQGPFMLAWALPLQAIENALVVQREASGRNIVPEHLHSLEDALEREQHEPIWRKLSLMAFHPRTALFPCLQQIASSPLLAALPVYPGVALAPTAALHYRSTLKRLVLASVQLVRPEYHSDFEALVWVLESICSSSHVHPDLAASLPKLCWQFWTSDLEARQGALILDTARRRWPASFRPLLRLLLALSGVTRLPTGGYTSPDASEEAAESLSSAISYFVNLPSLTFPLPPNNPVYGAFWRVVSGGSDGSAVYEAIRPIPILGEHVVPEGSRGVLISEEDSSKPIALWSLDENTSGWVLLRDFLLALIPPRERDAEYAASTSLSLLPRSADHDNVFAQGSNIAPFDFAALAPASQHESTFDVVSDAFDLFTAAVSSPQTATALLAHLRSWDGIGDEPADLSADGTVSLARNSQRGARVSPAHRTLSSIAIQLLHASLETEMPANRCTTSAYRLLAALVPYESKTIWARLRSTEFIPSQSVHASLSSTSRFHRSTASAHLCDRLLKTEIGTSSFTSTLAMLDFLSALSADLRSSHFATPTETLVWQSTKLAEGVLWVFGSVWTQLHGWGYRDSAERFLLAERCQSLFEAILDDPSLRLPDSGAVAVGSLVERLFVRSVDVASIRPLLFLVTEGNLISDALDQTDKLQLDIVERALTSALGFASCIVEQWQRLRSESGHLAQSLMVLAFFENSNVLMGPGRTVANKGATSAVLAYALADISPLVSIAALQLLQSVIRAAASLETPSLSLNLIAHLGSTSNIFSLRHRISEILEHSKVVPVQRELWRLLAVIASSQPALAALLLACGKDLPLVTNGAKDPTAVDADPSSSTPILDIAARELCRWKDRVEATPRLLEAVLQLLSSIWLQRSNLQSSIGAISEGEEMWSAVRQLALFKTAQPASLGSNIITRADGGWATDAHESVSRYCYQVTCKAAALDLLASEILYRCASTPLTPATRVAQTKVAVFKEAVQIAQGPDLVEALADACTVLAQPEREGRLQAMFKGSELGVSLAGIARQRPDEPFNQLYGDAFKYDGALLLDKLEAIAALQGDSASDLRTILLELACVNNDLSVSTVQRVLLWGWTHFLDAVTLHKTRLPWQATPAEQERRLLAAFIRCADATVSDANVEGYMVDVNRKRVKLLRIILKAAWDADDEADAVLRKENLSNTVKVIELTQRLVEQGFTSADAEARYESEVWASLHQDLLSLVGLCPPKIQAGLKYVGQSDEHASREAGIVLNKATEAFRRRALVALSSALQYGVEAMQKRTDLARLRACHEDLALTGSVLASLVSLPGGGGPALLQDLFHTGVINLMFTLIQLAPIWSPAEPQGTIDVNGQEEVWLFAQPLLSLVLALSCQPGVPEAVVLGGVMSALTANSLSEALEAGAVTPSPSAIASRPLFDCWLLMFRLVVSLIDNLNSGEGWSSPAARFVEEDVLGFARLYHLQILAAFEISASTFGDADGTFVINRTAQRKEKLSPGQLGSIEVAAQFYYGLCRAVFGRETGGSTVKRNPIMAMLLSALTDKASVLLQQAVYLLQHPMQVEALLQQEGSVTRTSSEEAIRILRDVAGNIVSAFFTITGPELLFVDEAPAAAPRRLVKPSLRTHPSEPASLGTLMDLSTHLIDSLRKLKSSTASSAAAASRASAPISRESVHLASTLEQTLALCATQLVVILSTPTSTAPRSANLGRVTEDKGDSTTSSSLYSEADLARRDAEAAKREVDAGLARDLKAAIKDARGAVVGALAVGGAGAGAGRFLDALAAFTTSRLAPFVEEEEDADED
ncbi:hypothetical protein V8E36_001087 [Tilletia maclaganii]